MSTSERQFEDELELFRTEAESAVQYFYAHLAIHEVARRRRDVFDLLNANAMFWMTVSGALQTAAFIAIGRIFDQDTPHNLDRLLKYAQGNIAMFSKAALGKRKQGTAAERPVWLDEYLQRVAEPSRTYFRRLRAKTREFRRIYESSYRPLRHKVYAHRAALNQAEVDRIVARTNIAEFERLFLFLLFVHDSLSDLLLNGRGTRRRRRRGLVKQSGRLRIPRTSLGSVHERMIRDAEKALVRAVRPNERMEPARRGSRKRAAHS